jgi:large subunit ribosomal protein L17
MAMLRGLVTYLLENGRIETTVTRAKELRSLAEKMITTAKTPSLHTKRQVLSFVTKEDVVKKLFDEIAPSYKDRNGGYTRIVRTGARRGDAAEMCIIELVKDEKKDDVKKGRGAAKPAARATRSARTRKAAPAAEVPEPTAQAVQEAPPAAETADPPPAEESEA